MSQIEFAYEFNAFRGALMAFALNLVKDANDAEDLVQETAYKAFKYKQMYKPHTNFRAWLLTIMRNTFINDYRRKKRRQVLLDKTDNNFFLNSGDQPVNNEGETNVNIEEIEQIIGELEAMFRIPFLLNFKGYKYQEIADELDLPLGTVKSRIFFARKRLQEALKKRFDHLSFEEMLVN